MAQAKEPPKSKASTEKTDEPPEVIRYCSFCGRPSSELRRLIAGPPPANSFICDECIEVCISVLYQDSPKYWQDRFLQIMANPQDLRIKPPENEQKQAKTNKGKES